MRLLVVVVAAACAAVAAAADECPCGLVGFPACATPGYVNGAGVDVPVPDLTRPNDGNGTCVADNVWRCEYDGGEKEATCRCYKGWDGELCDNKIKVLVWNLVSVNIVIPLLVMVGCGLAIMRSTKRNAGVRWRVPMSALTEGRASPKALLAFRICAVLFCLGTFADQMDRTGFPANWFMFRFYTVINFSLIFVVMAFGAVLSVQRVRTNADRDPTASDWADAPPLPTRGRVFLVLMQVEFASALLVSVITWSLLLPASFSNGTSETLTGFTSIAQHAFNSIIMATDMHLNGIPVYFEFAWWTLAWGALYMFYHGLLMAGELAAGDAHAPSYDFLSSANPLFVVFVVGLILASGAFHMAAYGLAKLAKPDVMRRAREQLQAGALPPGQQQPKMSL